MKFSQVTRVCVQSSSGHPHFHARTIHTYARCRPQVIPKGVHSHHGFRIDSGRCGSIGSAPSKPLGERAGVRKGKADAGCETQGFRFSLRVSPWKITKNRTFLGEIPRLTHRFVRGGSPMDTLLPYGRCRAAAPSSGATTELEDPWQRATPARRTA